MAVSSDLAASSALAKRAIDLLGTLVAFDTTSHRSNLDLIAWVETYLAGHGVSAERVPDASGAKSNLLATIGPRVAGGVVLSGHTDVVPVDGQPWTSDPFVLTRRGERLFGRGTCDMKGFIALALAAVPDILAAGPRRPAHLAFSYDEEIGCLGAPGLIRRMTESLPTPSLVLVGEPTSLSIATAHKGILYHEVIVQGREAHSSQPHLGASAIMTAVRLMAALEQLAGRLEKEADPASPFEPKWPTLTIGQVHGGTTPNILARECRFVFDLRSPAGVDTEATLADFMALAAAEDAAIRERAPDGGVSVRRVADVPAFEAARVGGAEALARRLAGDNGPAGTVSFGTEAGQFQAAGLPVILCGPGSIDQAHQPDEYVDIVQMQRGADMMTRLAAELASPPAGAAM
ncbi:MAG: argE [Caulobacteraceae bacterium]|nr:argE [Caulobacteraceae bacterium]